MRATRTTILFAALLVLLAMTLRAQQFVAPYVVLQGVLSNASGIPAQNATLTFQLNQVGFVAGTSTIVSASQCATDVNGAVVGVGNPQSGPRASVQYTGTLPAGNYYVEFTWYDQFGNQTLASPEVRIQLTAVGELQILPPVGNGPPQAVGMDVYIGTSSGGETYQGQTTSLTAQYTQALPLTTGTAAPTRNATPCRVFANDAIWPTGTGYQTSLVDASGNTLFQYPQMWQFLGPGSTYNLSQGIPYYNGQVTFPVPILSQPTNHNPQSINGPLSMGQPGGPGYNITNVLELGVGTNLPAWGVDAEGSGLAGAINAKSGYLVNGVVGASGQCLASDGSYADTWVTCVTSLPPLYYQTVITGTTAGSALTQRSYLAVGPGTGLTATDVAGVGGNVSRTQLEVNTQATVATDAYVTMNAASGTSGHCMEWDSAGGAGDAGGACAAVPTFTGSSGYQTLLGGLILEWGSVTPTTVNAPYVVTLPLAFPHACLAAYGGDNGTRVTAGNPSPTAAGCSSASTITVLTESTVSGGGPAESVAYLAIGW